MKKVLTIAMSILLWGVAGCSQETSSEEISEVVSVEAVNGTIEVEKTPERVVVFDLGILDTMDELGLSSNVVGVAKNSLPGYLNQYTGDEFQNIGSLKEPDFETIYALEPDLIIISNRQQESLDQLNEIAPTIQVAIDNASYWESYSENMNTIGMIFDKTAEVNTNLENLEEKTAKVKEEVESHDWSTLTVLLNEGNLSAYGPQSRYGILNDVFGFKTVDETIEPSTHGQSIAYEYVISENPDAIFVIDRTSAIGGDSNNNDMMTNPLIQETKAYKENRVINLDPELWYLSGGGLQSYSQMIEEIEGVLNQ